MILRMGRDEIKALYTKQIPSSSSTHTERRSICACVVNHPTRLRWTVATTEPHTRDDYPQMCLRECESHRNGSWSKEAVWRDDLLSGR